MALLDHYRGKGYVTVSSLTLAEKQELTDVVSQGQEAYRDLGFTLGRTLATVPIEETVPGSNIVAFRLDQPRVKAPQEPLSREKVRIYTAPRPIPKLSKKESEAQVKRYAKELAARGIEYSKEEAPELPETSSQTTWLRWVLTGQRKAAMVDEYNADQARQWGLVAFKTPHGSFTGPVARNRAFIVYHPGKAANAKEVVRILQKYPPGKRGPDYMREMGAALGAPAAETEKTIQAFYGKKGAGGAPWLGVLSLAILVLFLIPRRSEA